MLAIRIIKQAGQHFSKHNLKPHESAMDPLSVYYITEIRMTQKAYGKKTVFFMNSSLHCYSLRTNKYLRPIFVVFVS